MCQNYLKLNIKNKGCDRIRVIEVNNINECSIKLKVISFKDRTYLIFKLSTHKNG